MYKIGDYVVLEAFPETHWFLILEIDTHQCSSGTQVHYKGRLYVRYPPENKTVIMTSPWVVESEIKEEIDAAELFENLAREREERSKK